MSKTKIQIQYFSGCPNSSEMISRVKSAMEGIEDVIDYEEILIDSNELTENIKLRGSPTLLIDGKDYESLLNLFRLHLVADFILMDYLRLKI